MTTLKLKREYDRLLPHLKALSERELAHAKSTQEKNLGLGVSQAFEFGQQFNQEYVPLIPTRVRPRTELGIPDAPSWRSFRPMYLSWLLDWTCHSVGRQLYRGHKHCYILSFISSHCVVVRSRSVLYHMSYTTRFGKHYTKECISHKELSILRTREAATSAASSPPKISHQEHGASTIYSDLALTPPIIYPRQTTSSSRPKAALP